MSLNGEPSAAAAIAAEILADASVRLERTASLPRQAAVRDRCAYSLQVPSAMDTELLLPVDTASLRVALTVGMLAAAVRLREWLVRVEAQEVPRVQ